MNVNFGCSIESMALPLFGGCAQSIDSLINIVGVEHLYMPYSYIKSHFVQEGLLEPGIHDIPIFWYSISQLFVRLLLDMFHVC